MGKGVVRLIPVLERGRQLFGEANADMLADEFKADAVFSPQLNLFIEASSLFAPSGTAGRSSCASPMLSPLCTSAAATRSDCWTLCC